jgi:hypothetical protein
VSPAGPPPDPKRDRFKPVERALQVAVVVVGALALFSVLLPGRASEITGTAAIVALMVVPLARVLWLAQRWLRRGDVRYGLVAVSVLLITAVGALLAR